MILNTERERDKVVYAKSTKIYNYLIKIKLPQLIRY